MKIEWSSSLVARARVYAALGEPARLAIVDRLSLGDASPGELGRALGLATNLLAHHVKLLAKAGVVERSRSEGDHRRTYLRLRPAVLTGAGPAGAVRAPRVVFVCTHNSARSQLATALWQRGSDVPATSAGTEPVEDVHPMAVAAAREHGLSLSHARTAHVSDVLAPTDLVVAVCDTAHEHLGERAPERLHWSVPDPVRAGTRAAFDHALRDLADRVGRLAPVVDPEPGAPDVRP
ncbi:MAG: helix-turn-helix domain-containing protein [Actinophytocola sp.]|uniref:arsenate reductase/protein-tyrosine-phosphatase family protein n=1 Tax=Actinophytocola sp. TaxID=1872138 RepID=UPI003C75BEC6